MGNVLVGETENFKIWYDPNLYTAHPEVITNANNLMSTVERDFEITSSWFGINGGFGQGNRINVNLTYQGTAGADNEGYHSDQTTQINLNGAPAATPVPDVIRMLFVNELVEIFMSYNNQNAGGAWNAGDSNGEGLSQFSGYTMAPVGHNAFYGVGQENPWMQSPRSGQYITGPPDGTDKNKLSYGCAFLYLLYLNSQLGYSPQAIVQANGATLQNTYQTLTGNSDGFTPFLTLLNNFFPQGTSDPKSGLLEVANPFPLLYSAGRSVSFAEQSYPLGPPLLLNTGEAYVSPLFGLCPKKWYQYTIVGQPQQIVVNATTHGFGQASFAWTLNGVPLGGEVSVLVTVTGQDIEGSQVENQDLVYSWTATPVNRLSEQLVLTFSQPFGQFALTIGCIATELFATADSESATLIEYADDRLTQWDQQFYNDREACLAPILQAINRHVQVHIPFWIAMTLPDPPPDYSQAVQILKNAGQALAILDTLPERERRLVDELVEARLGIRASTLRELGGQTRSGQTEQ